jgi:hypothetical protein
MYLETNRLRGKRRNKWKNELRDNGSIVVGEAWQEKLYNREEW